MDIQKTIQNLQKHGFTVSYFKTGAEAASHLVSQLHGKTIGIGGSVTIDQLGVYDQLTKENTVFWHWKQQPAKEVRASSLSAQVYLTSANAIAQSGEIINIDGSGNRISASLYNHEKVIFIVGTNKIADDYDSAMWRARNIAAPLNARRLHRKTPCAMGKELKCYDCDSPERICNGVSVLLRKMGGIPEMEVILIDEDLGY
ncbi:lactate utilization protein [Caproicibacterium sp. BJN0003]|uniref:lactate utilization protein n=1 Tax=Caproicibacterium sp. BJN0003 TaxID=2994078 RepID=UPI00224FF0E7|nr:lactate utilization protein [Caproicibacterium sp. BJN0003]UZT82067.1 lactate utilization protein [Caproicibacterium sp. BJN0003]